MFLQSVDDCLYEHQQQVEHEINYIPYGTPSEPLGQLRPPKLSEVPQIDILITLQPSPIEVVKKTIVTAKKSDYFSLFSKKHVF